MIKKFAEIAPSVGDQGFGGTVMALNGLFTISGIMPGKTPAQVQQAFGALQNLDLGLDAKSAALYAGLWQFGSSPSWYDYGVQNFGGNQKEGFGLITASWLIPNSSFSDPTKLGNQLQDAATKGAIGGGFGFLQVGGGSSGARGQGPNRDTTPELTSVTPAWNTAI